MKTKRCCIYVRVSTGEQRTAMQERELIAYAKHRNWAIKSVYRDIGSGGNDKRPALQQLLSECRAKRRGFDVVLVWKFDRFARSLSFLLNSLELLRKQGIDFVSATEQIDSTQPHGEMIFQIIAVIAQWERSLIRERVKAGISAAKARGVRMGRPPLTLLTQQQIRSVIAERNKGRMTFRALARKYGVSVWTAHRLCKGH